MTALFGSSAVAASKNLVEFRAGKMSLKGTTVTADKRKGLVYVYQSDDSLMHFCWKDRTAGTLEDDLIIFPDDVEFKRVSQCTTGRVYILKFKSSSRKFFFWMQEPKDDKDEENCKKVNEVLNNPPTPGSQTSGAGEGLPAGLSGLQPALASLGDQLGDTSLQSLLNNMDENQLMQLLGMGSLGGAMLDSHPPSRSNNASAAATRASAGSAATSRPQSNAVNTTSGSTPTTTTATSQSASSEKKSEGDNKAATTGSQPAVQLSDLQSILSNMQVPAQQESVDLSSSFSTEALIPLLSDKDVQTRLKPFLPVVDNLPESSEELKQTLQSPQFKQALSVFSAALQSGQLAPLMQQFKLNQSATDAAAKGDIIAFVKALQEDEAASDVKVEDEVEDMALD